MSKEIGIIKKPYPRTENFELQIQVGNNLKAYTTYGMFDPRTIDEDETPKIISVLIGKSTDGSYLPHESRNAAIDAVNTAYHDLLGINYKDTCSITISTASNPVVIRDHITSR